MQIVETAIFVNLSKFTAHAGITGVALPAVDCTLLTEWQVSFAFFQPGSPAAALPGATFRFALKETPTGDPLIFNSSLTASGAVYTADISSVDSTALRTLIGDQPSIAVVGEIEWTISSRRERVHFPVTVTNAWARPDDAAPDPVAEASIVWFTEQLANRAVRFDVAQTLTTQQKTQGRDNLGITGTGGGSSAWADITGKPSTFPPSAHTHAIADVTGLQTALDAKAASSHTQAISTITGLQTALDAKAASSHTQAISTITGLQTALDGKANIVVATAGVAEQVEINFSGTNGTGLNSGYYMVVYDINGSVGVWWSNGFNSEPTPSFALSRWIAVPINNEFEDVDLASATAGALDADAAFIASASGTVVSYTLAQNGQVNDANLGNTGLLVTIITQGVNSELALLTYNASNLTSIPAANLTGTIDNDRLPSTITGLTSVTSSAFVGALTGTASGNLPLSGGTLNGNLTVGPFTSAYVSIQEVNNEGTLRPASLEFYNSVDGYGTTIQPGAITDNVTVTLPTSSGIVQTTNTLPATIQLACSDETTALTAGTAKVTFRMPYAIKLTAVRASVTTAPTGSTLIVDINEAGTSILSTKLSIDATEKTSATAASAAVISDPALANDAEITIDIDQIGSTVAGAGLKVTLIGTRA